MRAVPDAYTLHVLLQFARAGEPVLSCRARLHRCTVRAAAPADFGQDALLRELRALFGGAELVRAPRAMVGHAMNCPFPDKKTLVYYCHVPIPLPRTIDLSRCRGSVRLVDFVRNGEAAPEGTVSTRQLLQAELEHARILAPQTVDNLGPLAQGTVVDLADTSLTTLFDSLRGPVGVRLLDASAARRYTQIVYHAAPALASPADARAAAAADGGGDEDDGGRISSSDAADGGRVQIHALPARLYALRCRYEDAGRAVLCCYEELMSRLYGEKYALSVANALKPDKKLLDDALHTALAIGRLAEMPLDEVFSGSQLKTSARFLAASYETASLLPLPRFAPGAPLAGKRKVDAYQGGHILPAKSGLHRAGATIFDFDSHYPAIIAEYGLFPGPVDSRRDDDDDDAKNARDALYGNLLRLIEAKRTMARSPSRRAHKLVSVVIYGSFGSTHSRNYSRDIAEKITEHGRRLLGSARDALSRRGLESIYGHTDSVMTAPPHKELSDAECQRYCDAFNSGHRQVKLTVERRMLLSFVLNRTQYVGLEARVESRERLRLYAEFANRARVCLSAGKDRAAAAAAPFSSGLCAVHEQYAAAIRVAKEFACFPGLISAARPRAANLLCLQLWLAALLVWAEQMSLQEACRSVQQTMDVIDVPTSSVLRTALPLWTSEFSPAPPPKSGHTGDSFRAKCSARFWDTVRTGAHGTPSFAASNVMQRHATLYSYRDANGADQAISKESVQTTAAMVDKAHWVAQLYQSFARHLHALSANNATVPDSLLAPLATWAHCLRPRAGPSKRPQHVAKRSQYEVPPKTLALDEVERYLARSAKHELPVRRLIASELLERANRREQARILADTLQDSLDTVKDADQSLYCRLAHLCVRFLGGADGLQ